MISTHFVSALSNHLWQSTVFAALAGLLAWLLRKNTARVRYWSMTQSARRKLGFGRKVLLTAGVASVGAVPVLFGMLHAPQNRAESQTDTTVPLAFEVASVKPNKSTDWRHFGMRSLPGGRFTAVNAPLFLIIARAYNVPFQSTRLSGGPDWIRSEKYDIEATAEKGAISPGLPAKLRDEKMRLMLQALLADRFKLTVRRETKEQPVYVVVVAKNGPKLQKAKVEEKDCSELPDTALTCHQFSGGQGQGLHGKAVDISDLALFVSNWTDRPVIDKTDLQGLFDIQSDGWVPMRPRPALSPGAEPTVEDLASADPTRPTLLMIFERLGLKLESQKAPVEMLVIDHVERPSEN